MPAAGCAVGKHETFDRQGSARSPQEHREIFDEQAGAYRKVLGRVIRSVKPRSSCAQNGKIAQSGRTLCPFLVRHLAFLAPTQIPYRQTEEPPNLVARSVFVHPLQLKPKPLAFAPALGACGVNGGERLVLVPGEDGFLFVAAGHRHRV